jgi:hypothetical protein
MIPSRRPVPICILHPFFTLLLYSFSNGKPSVIDSYFQPFMFFIISSVREFTPYPISLVSAKDQAFRASSLIVYSLYKLYRFLGSSIVEFSTRFSSPFLQSKRPVAILPVKPLPRAVMQKCGWSA